MPQSLSQVIIRMVFSTKDRRPLLDPVISPRMHAYLATVCRDCNCAAYRVGGTADHVHIAARWARTISQADLLEQIKKTSSAWIKTQGEQYDSFFWQGGYGDFSIGWSQLKELMRYIDNQEKHHHTETFQEEYRSLLRKYHVDYDERYVWDRCEPPKTWPHEAGPWPALDPFEPNPGLRLRCALGWYEIRPLA